MSLAVEPRLDCQPGGLRPAADVRSVAPEVSTRTSDPAERQHKCGADVCLQPRGSGASSKSSGGRHHARAAEKPDGCRLGNNGLRLTVEEIVHRDDIDTTAVAGPQLTVAGDDAHARHGLARVEDHAEE